MNIVPSTVWYYTRTLVQYDILLGTIITNIHAITLLLYSNKYFFFRSVINAIKIWFFHISLLYCTGKNSLIFELVQYEFYFISWGSTSSPLSSSAILSFQTTGESKIWEMTFGTHGYFFRILYRRSRTTSSAILTFQCWCISWSSTSSPLFKRKAMSSSAILSFQTTGESKIWEMTFGTHRYFFRIL